MSGEQAAVLVGAVLALAVLWALRNSRWVR